MSDSPSSAHEEDAPGVEEYPPKFDIQKYTSRMDEWSVTLVAMEFGIPKDLHPRLPPENMTMDKLPNDAIG